MRAPHAVSLIVVSYNTRGHTLRCVDSLRAASPPGTEVIVVDNASSDGTVEALRTCQPAVRVMEQPLNLGFARACNLGAREATGGYVGFVNSDCAAERECVSRLAAFLDVHAEASAVVPRLVGPGGEVQRNVAPLPSVGSIASEYLLGRISDPYGVTALREPTRVASCSGAALLIRREDFWAAGGFHEAYFMYVEDLELSRRLGELAKRIYYLPDAVMFHAEGGSSRPRAGALGAMLERHRRDYIRRTMNPLRAGPALLAMRLGALVTPARNRLLALVRGR